MMPLVDSAPQGGWDENRLTHPTPLAAKTLTSTWAYASRAESPKRDNLLTRLVAGASEPIDSRGEMDAMACGWLKRGG